MSLIRVRKQGNSTVVTLPQEILDQAHVKDGDLVEERVDDRGRIVLEAVSVQPRVSAKMAAAIKSSAKKDRHVLNRLAAHDRR